MVVEQFACDNTALNLGSSLHHGKNLGFTQQAGHGIFLENPIAAVDLDGHVGGASGQFAGEQFGGRTFYPEGLIRIRPTGLIKPRRWCRLRDSNT